MIEKIVKKGKKIILDPNDEYGQTPFQQAVDNSYLNTFDSYTNRDLFTKILAHITSQKEKLLKKQPKYVSGNLIFSKDGKKWIKKTITLSIICIKLLQERISEPIATHLRKL